MPLVSFIRHQETKFAVPGLAEGILAGEVADGVVVIILGIGSADGVQAIQFIVGNEDLGTVRHGIIGEQERK